LSQATGSFEQHFKTLRWRVNETNMHALVKQRLLLFILMRFDIFTLTNVLLCIDLQLFSIL
ncbi:MAG: hypothetical protein IIW85_04560, partial [Bacteroidaceae bacterium]|nr:hypothetical protein [Bacteroidaceae bacterium]